MQGRISQAAVNGDAFLAERLAEAYPKVAVMMLSDVHWISGIRALEAERKGVPINPRKRAATICKFLEGPDIRKHAVGMSEPKGNPTWKRAGRRAQVLIEMMAQGVAPDNAGEFLRLVKSPEALLQDREDRKRNGGHLPGPKPGTAEGATEDGRPITVKLSEAVGPALMAGATKSRPLTAVRLPDSDGRVVVEITGEAPPVVIASPVKPNLPPGQMHVHLQGERADVKQLADGQDHYQRIRVRHEKAEDGGHIFHILAVKADANHAVAKIGSAGRPGSATLPSPGAAGGSVPATLVARPAFKPADKPAYPTKRVVATGTNGATRGAVLKPLSGRGSGINPHPQPQNLPVVKPAETAVIKRPEQIPRPGFRPRPRAT